MKFTEAMIAWNPGTDEIAVGPWPDSTRWSDAYKFTTGACLMELHKMQPETQRAMLFIHFNTIVVRDCVSPQVAHRAFLAIDEYRLAISPDQLGAEDAEGPLNKPWQNVVKERLEHAPQPRRRV
jgi:hypothetical protein